MHQIACTFFKIFPGVSPPDPLLALGPRIASPSKILTARLAGGLPPARVTTRREIPHRYLQTIVESKEVLASGKIVWLTGDNRSRRSVRLHVFALCLWPSNERIRGVCGEENYGCDITVIRLLIWRSDAFVTLVIVTDGRLDLSLIKCRRSITFWSGLLLNRKYLNRSGGRSSRESLCPDVLQTNMQKRTSPRWSIPSKDGCLPYVPKTFCRANDFDRWKMAIISY